MIQWNQEVMASLVWLLKTTGLTLIAGVPISALLFRYTQWGRQFWSLARYYLHPRLGGIRPLLGLLSILFFTLAGVRLNVLFSMWFNEMYSAMQKLDEAGFWKAIFLFSILATIHVVRALIAAYLNRAFTIHWRENLNEYFLGRWLNQQNFYKAQYLAETVDNPDQRIQQDIASFTDHSLNLSMGIIDALISTVEFTAILWGLSGVLPLFGQLEVPRGMVFLAYLYVGVATWFAFKIGKPLIKLNFLSEKLSADYRYALVRFREYAESIAFYAGERTEKVILLGQFKKVIHNSWALLSRNLKFSGFNLSVSQLAVIFPMLIQAKRFFSKQITLGDLMQTNQAFGQLRDNLSFFRSAYDDIALLKAELDRLIGFDLAMNQAQALPLPSSQTSMSGFEVLGLSVTTPHHKTLIENMNLKLKEGQKLLVRGESGSGKTTFLRAVAGLWPFASGQIIHPKSQLFLSQKPYLPIGSLREALSYPQAAVPLNLAQSTLQAVGLEHLAGDLDTVAEWSRILSLGEQQRLAFGRLLLTAPAIAYLDEATSALDEKREHFLYSLLKEKLPQTTVVSVGHRQSLVQFHDMELKLSGSGPWGVQPLEPSINA